MADTSRSFLRTNYLNKDFQQLIEELKKDLNNRYGILQQDGYIQTPNYNPYINQPNSICMGKKL